MSVDLLFPRFVRLVLIMGLASSTLWAQERIKQQIVQLRAAGTGFLNTGEGVDVGNSDRSLEFRRQNLDALTAETIDVAASTRTMVAASLSFPTVANSSIAGTNPRFFGFDALDHSDQRFAGTGAFVNSQFSDEPPDQGLCVGNSFVVEAVNLALAVYDKSGNLLSGPTALNQFFNLHPSVVRSSPPVFGESLSDPRCLYDAQTNRFFVTILELDVDPPTGNLTGNTNLLLAVSKTGDPTGAWNLFELSTTADGSADCPCFGDQPLIGTDANGLYVSANSFSLVTGGFRGVQIYAASKLFLAAGVPPPFVLHASLSPATNADGSRAFSLQPSVRAHGQQFEDFGSEYFLSSFNTRLLLENNVIVWALRNTALLQLPPGPETKFVLLRKVVASEVYGVPPDATQKMGPLFLGPMADPGVFELLSTNEHRMQQVTFAEGQLWSSVTTGLQSPGEASLKAGVAWFAVHVEVDDGELDAKIGRQGYVAIENGNVFFPAVGVGGEGRAAIGFSISASDVFPSTGYVQIRSNGKTGPIHFAGLGAGSEDGFSGYPNQSPVPPPCDPSGKLCSARWGDYGAATVDTDGSIWLANEYIGPRPRSFFANWGTFITRLSSDD